jgi:hypothetical protein
MKDIAFILIEGEKIRFSRGEKFFAPTGGINVGFNPQRVYHHQSQEGE